MRVWVLTLDIDGEVAVYVHASLEGARAAADELCGTDDGPDLVWTEGLDATVQPMRPIESAEYANIALEIFEREVGR